MLDFTTKLEQALSTITESDALGQCRTCGVDCGPNDIVQANPPIWICDDCYSHGAGPTSDPYAGDHADASMHDAEDGYGPCAGCGRKCGPEDKEGTYWVCRHCDEAADRDANTWRF